MQIALLGDIALFGRCTRPEYFEEVAEYLSHFDLVVGNLESPFSVKKKTHGAKSAYICSDISNINLLKTLHIHAVTLANNHMFDYGKEGYETTKEVLEQNGIDYFGGEGKRFDFDCDDNHLSFEGFCCYSSNPLETVEYGTYGVNEYNVTKADEIITRHEAEGRLSVLTVHAGLEHVNYPSLDHVKAARYLAKKHHYIYCGHHPHVAQGIESIEGSLIAYSLGNFCFDDIWTSSNTEKPLIEMTENNRSSFILVITIEHNIVKDYDIIPIFIGEDKILVGCGVTKEMLMQYTDKINAMNATDYERMRKNILDARNSERRNARTVGWYLKRLRPRYFKMIINAHANIIKFEHCLRIV